MRRTPEQILVAMAEASRMCSKHGKELQYSVKVSGYVCVDCEYERSPEGRLERIEAMVQKLLDHMELA